MRTLFTRNSVGYRERVPIDLRIAATAFARQDEPKSFSENTSGERLKCDIGPTAEYGTNMTATLTAWFGPTKYLTAWTSSGCCPGRTTLSPAWGTSIIAAPSCCCCEPKNQMDCIQRLFSDHCTAVPSDSNGIH